MDGWVGLFLLFQYKLIDNRGYLHLNRSWHRCSVNIYQMEQKLYDFKVKIVTQIILILIFKWLNSTLIWSTYVASWSQLSPFLKLKSLSWWETHIYATNTGHPRTASSWRSDHRTILMRKPALWFTKACEPSANSFVNIISLKYSQWP